MAELVADTDADELEETISEDEALEETNVLLSDSVLETAGVEELVAREDDITEAALEVDMTDEDVALADEDDCADEVVDDLSDEEDAEGASHIPNPA